MMMQQIDAPGNGCGVGNDHDKEDARDKEKQV